MWAAEVSAHLGVLVHDSMIGTSSLFALVPVCFICGKLSLVCKHGKCSSPELRKQWPGMRLGCFKFWELCYLSQQFRLQSLGLKCWSWSGLLRSASLFVCTVGKRGSFYKGGPWLLWRRELNSTLPFLYFLISTWQMSSRGFGGFGEPVLANIGRISIRWHLKHKCDLSFTLIKRKHIAGSQVSSPWLPQWEGGAFPSMELLPLPVLWMC